MLARRIQSPFKRVGLDPEPTRHSPRTWVVSTTTPLGVTSSILTRTAVSATRLAHHQLRRLPRGIEQSATREATRPRQPRISWSSIALLVLRADGRAVLRNTVIVRVVCQLARSRAVAQVADRWSTLAGMSDDVSATSTVLVVDDEPNVRAVLERMARFHGFMPIATATVEEAVAIAEQRTIIAFILDLNLKGGRSGLEVLAWLRLQPRYARTPVFVLTGQLDTRDEDKTVIRDYGARVFYKGLSTQALFAELRSQLSERDPD